MVWFCLGQKMCWIDLWTDNFEAKRNGMSQVSPCNAVTPKLEQQTQFTLEAQFKWVMHNMVGR